MKLRIVVAALLAVPATLGATLPGSGSSHANKAGRQAGVHVSRTAEDPGERIFEQNCVRCHKPPMSVSPRMTETIVMHMRVRARLSQSQEQELLRYLAP